MPGLFCSARWGAGRLRKGEGRAAMKASDVRRAVTAGVSTAAALGLTVNDAIVVHDSNKLTVRLLPCEVIARVAPAADQVAQFEIELAQRLAESGSPVAALEPRVEPCVYEHDGFAVTLWNSVIAARSGGPVIDLLGRAGSGMTAMLARAPAGRRQSSALPGRRRGSAALAGHGSGAGSCRDAAAESVVPGRHLAGGQRP